MPASSVPLVLQDDLGISLGLFARFDFGNGKTGLCEIDTGSPGITIDKSLAASLGVKSQRSGTEHVRAAPAISQGSTRRSPQSS